MKDFLDARVIAVVGASRNPEKYGYKVFVHLLKKGGKVYPVNPKAEEIAGVKAYPSLSSLPEKPELVITVVPPSVTEKVVDECIRLGIKKIWMQPGSESKAAIEKAEKAGIAVVYNLCFVVDGLKEEFKL
jgi:predicted CoA-binding protein